MSVTMTAAGTLTLEKELIISRVFDAPRDLVFKAWTDPNQIKQWWGPRSFTVPDARVDLRVGGRYLLDMRGPDGRDYWSTGVYREVVVPERIVASDSFSDAEGNIVPASLYGMSADYPLALTLAVTFEAAGDKTRVTVRHFGHPPGQDLTNAQIGWAQTLDKLGDYLRTLRGVNADEPVLISRWER
jgi:uncharacterized protein YndB with AHSA1/START domain